MHFEYGYEKCTINLCFDLWESLAPLTAAVYDILYYIRPELLKTSRVLFLDDV